MKPLEFDSILDQCIARVQAGEPMADCLAEFPDFAAELRPLLALSEALHGLPELLPSSEAAASGKARMFESFDRSAAPDTTPQAAQAPTPAKGWIGRLTGWISTGRDRQPPIMAVARAALILIGLIAAGGFVADASADSLPGDQLYGVKRLVEDTRLTLSLDDADRSQLRAIFNARRREEVMALKAAGRTGEVEFSGQLAVDDNNQWTIDGILVEPATDLALPILDANLGEVVTVDSVVEVDGTITISGVDAPVEPSDSGQAPLPSPTPTSDRPIKATPSPERPTTTATEAAPTRTQAAASPTPQPSPTSTALPTAQSTLPPFPTSAPTQTATARPRPTQVEATETTTPTASPVVRPTQTATGLPTVRPTATPRPTKTETAIPTLRPTKTAEPSPTAKATETVGPLPTALPTDRPKPTATPTRGDLPVPTAIVEPTATPADRVSQTPTAISDEPTPTPIRDEAVTPTRPADQQPTATAVPDRDGAASPTPSDDR